MFKVLFLIATLLAMPPFSDSVEKTPEESRQDLLAAGLSPQAADGIIKIGVEAQFPKDGPTPSPMQAFEAFIKLFQDLDAFIKTQSQQDQDVYNAMLEKKKQEIGAQFAAATAH